MACKKICDTYRKPSLKLSARLHSYQLFIPVTFLLTFILTDLMLTEKNAFCENRVTTLNEQTSLAGPWKIYYGDDKKYAAVNFNDSSWGEVQLPASLIQYFLKNYNTLKGIFWIRKTIVIDRSLPGEDIGLILGRIGNADETYFNGEKIGGLGKFPPDEFSMWNHPRYYMVPRSLIKYGEKNVIAVRISFHFYAEIMGKLAIAGMEEWMKNKIWDNFFILDLNYVIIAMGIPIFLIFFLFYIRRRTSQEYLFYCLQLFCGLFAVLDLVCYWNIYGSMLMRLKIYTLGWVALNVVHPIFLHRIYNLKRRKIEIALWSYLVLMTILLYPITGTPSDQRNLLLIIGITTNIGIYNVSCHISALVKKSQYARLFSFFGITVIIGAMHDGILYFSKFYGKMPDVLGYKFPYMIFPYTAAFLYLGTTLVLVSRIIGMMDENEDLNTSLEGFVIENALLNDRTRESGSTKKPAEPRITTKTEEKIKKVISYIEENYKSDISREGLAASVDVHPDNLGKLFKTYTRQKLGDYICELRITDAKKKLIETDDSIIDIAFSSGFESLRTFTRIFPKYTGLTPKKYRKLHKK